MFRARAFGPFVLAVLLCVAYAPTASALAIFEAFGLAGIEVEGDVVVTFEDPEPNGPILFADHICALDITDQPSVARTLLRGIERLAEQHGCSAIHTTLTQTEALVAGGWISNILHERGHCVKGLQMCKLIPDAGSPRPLQH